MKSPSGEKVLTLALPCPPTHSLGYSPEQRSCINENHDCSNLGVTALRLRKSRRTVLCRGLLYARTGA